MWLHPSTPRLLVVIGTALLAFAGMAWKKQLPTASAPTSLATAQCPMHPAVRGRPQDRCTLCGMNLVNGALCGPVVSRSAGPLVLLSPESVRLTGVRTSEVRKGPLRRTLRIAGMIGEDDSRHGIISAPVEGRVDGLSMNHEGQTITQRQPLASIFSPTLLAAAKEYQSALAVGGQPLEDAKRRLEHYGLVWEQIKTIPDRQPSDLYFGILSPRSGTIVKSFIVEGQSVKAGDKLFEVADFTKMWFHAMIPEQDVPFVKPGQIVQLRTASLPGVTLTSRIYNISPNFDDMNAKIRVVLENPERKLKNNLFAEGEVHIEVENTLTVSRSAVLWPGNTPRAYVEKGAGHYEARALKLGRIGDADYEVLEGLKEGERVVTSGNMLIDGQAQLLAAKEPGESGPL
ncbi:MAG: efflux RND transporter periplasmic adaptor subunit [Roseimicrobium sp.]